MATENVVILDVGGAIFKFSRECLLKYPGTNLTDILLERAKRDDENYPVTLFFNRDPTIFHFIGNYYRTSELHLPTNVCGASIRKELEFWKIPESVISPCCWRPLYLTDQDEDVEKNLNEKLKEEDIKLDHLSSFKQVQYKLWLLLDKPNSSKGAKVWNTLFMGTTIISALVAVLESVPSMREWQQHLADEYNTTLVLTTNISPKMVKLIFTTPHKLLLEMDIICLVIFTIEFILHFATCLRKGKFFKNVTNWIDFIAVFSGLSIQFTVIGFTNKVFPETLEGVYIYFVLKCAYTCRLLKLFRLSERFLGLKIMLLSIWHSRKELLLLIFAFVILATIFGSIQYYCEFANNDFASIPISIWWAVITMTTVGYGDYFPKSGMGYVVGTVCSLVGVLILSMPVAVIAANFNDYYSRGKCGESKKAKKASTSFVQVGAALKDH